MTSGERSELWTQTTDEELMALVQVGNLQAFDEIVARYERHLYRFLRANLDTVSQAEDVLQETLLRIFTQRHKYKNQGNFKAWIYRIARNLCIDYRRAAGRRPIGHWIGHEDLNPDGDEGVESTPEYLDTARDSVYSRELREHMEVALDALSPKEREAFLLRRVEDMSYEEISQCLGCTLSAAKMRVKRAFDKVTRFMKGVLQDDMQTDADARYQVGR